VLFANIFFDTDLTIYDKICSVVIVLRLGVNAKFDNIASL
jgi:hypothetical protein